jgi:hypothetical protein
MAHSCFRAELPLYPPTRTSIVPAPSKPNHDQTTVKGGTCAECIHTSNKEHRMQLSSSCTVAQSLVCLPTYTHGQPRIACAASMHSTNERHTTYYDRTQHNHDRKACSSQHVQSCRLVYGLIEAEAHACATAANLTIEETSSRVAFDATPATVRPGPETQGSPMHLKNSVQAAEQLLGQYKHQKKCRKSYQTAQTSSNPRFHE